MEPILNNIADLIKKFIVDIPNLDDDKIEKIGKLAKALSPLIEAAARGTATSMKESQ